MKKILFLLLLSTSLLAAEQVPKLTGTVVISIKTGAIDADFKLENIPKIKDYLIFLNSGFNIQYFRNSEDTSNYAFEKEYNTNYSYESFGYYFPDNTGKSKFLPSALQFKYTGKFPVISNMDKASDRGDWKGNIAFNGKTIRTDGLQTAWYPVLYDIKKDKRYESLTYDIEVICNDCNSIYVNGSKPIASTKGEFIREKPTQLTLFAGEYDIAEKEGTYYLNAGFSTEQLNKFDKTTSTFKQYYQKNLSIPYGESIVYIHTTPVSKKNGWLFVSYPSIVNIGHDSGFHDLFDEDKSSWFKPFLAHELAHYYFGTYRKFNSELGDMFSESFSEFLALKITKQLIDEKIYLDNVNKKLSELENNKFTAMKYIKTNSDYKNRNNYVYKYAPIIWLAVEKEIGEEKMWNWLNKILTSKIEKTNYDFMLKTLREVLNDESKLNTLIKNYFANNNAIENASLAVKIL